MATLDECVSGVKSYLEDELVARVQGWQKWVVGGGLALALDKAVPIFNTLKTNPIVSAMDVIDENDDIDIDRIERVLLEQAEKSAVTFNMPLVGAVTLKADDVRKIFTRIRGKAK